MHWVWGVVRAVRTSPSTQYVPHKYDLQILPDTAADKRFKKYLVPRPFVAWKMQRIPDGKILFSREFPNTFHIIRFSNVADAIYAKMDFDLRKIFLDDPELEGEAGQ